MTQAAAFIVSLSFFLPLAASAQAQEKQITVKDIYATASPAETAPSQLAWSPDGRHLTYLDGGELADLDPATAKSHVLVSREKMASLSEQGGTEQDKDHRARYHMAGYLWAPDSSHLLFDSNGRLWFYDLKTGTGVQVGDSGAASGDDPKFSPDGKSLSFLRDHGIRVLRLSGAATAIGAAPSPGAAGGKEILNGEVDWVYAEELDARSNYFWSPDSNRIAYLETNETNVPRYPIEDWIPTHATVAEQRYPQPGDSNPAVRVGVVSAKGGKTVWIKLPIKAGDDYIPRFGWASAKTLWIETLSRSQKRREVYLADAASGESRQALEIDDAKFIDDKYDVRVQDGYIALTNWSSGYTHIYLYAFDTAHPLAGPARLERQLTNGDFDVSEVYRLDAKNKLVDYVSNEGNPLEKQLWEVSFDGQRRQLSSGAGVHEGSFAPAGAAFTDRQSARTMPPVLRICAGAGKCSVFWQSHALDAYHMVEPKVLQVKAHDGTTLYATLLVPEGAAKASVPLITNPYGGPGEQMVINNWGGLLFDELLLQHGFAVLHADNRGSNGRGRDFAQAVYHNFGPVQLEDQLTVIDAALAQYPQLDPKRLGWWGWSWGGTFTLYAMTHSDRFRAGVAVAPVTDWRNYDSIYTERYMGLPAENEQGYHDNSVVNSAANLKGRLLLVHGTGDDNVHIGNSVQFIQKLIEAGVPYDLQIYPRKTHGISGADARIHLFDRIVEQFEEYLKPAAAQ